LPINERGAALSGPTAGDRKLARSSSSRSTTGLRLLQAQGTARAQAETHRPAYYPEEGEADRKSEVLHVLKSALIISGWVLGIGLLLSEF
jgi:hypothetical protein